MEEPFFLNGVSLNEYVNGVLTYKITAFQI